MWNTIKQNLEESYKRPEKHFKISDMIITNAPSVPHYQIVKILGIEHAHTILTEEEISRNAYINQRLLAQDLEANELGDFKTYKKLFERLRPMLRILANAELIPRSFYLKYCFPITKK